MHSLFDEFETGTGPPGPTAHPIAAPRSGERAMWDAWKVQALPGFVAPYCRTLAASRLHRSCWWMDGLTPGRRKAPGRREAEALAELTETLAATGFLLRALRLEPPGARGKRAEDSPLISRGELLERLGASPTVLALDLLAAPVLTAEELLPLCQRAAPTEFLLPISSARLERLAVLSLEAGPSGKQDALGPAAETGPAPLTALLRTDAWKGIWSGPGKSAEKVSRTLELLRGLLKTSFLHVCLAPLDVQPTPTPRQLLLFATRQYTSVALMNDFLCAEQARLAAEREARALQGNWFARRREQARAAAWSALKEELHTLGRQRRARLWPELKPLLVLAHFGEFSSSDHDNALAELLAEGRVQCRWSPQPARSGPIEGTAPADAQRVPGQQDFLEFLQPSTRPVWRREVGERALPSK